MATVNIHEAKTQLSKLIAQVEAGESVTLARAGRPVARLVPIEAVDSVREPGVWRGQVQIADDFDELPVEVSDAFDGAGH